MLQLVLLVRPDSIRGVMTLQQVYGTPPRRWIDGIAEPLSWIPKGQPAWLCIKNVDFPALAAPSFEI